MTLVKWEPFRDLMAMQDRMTRLIDETLSRMWKEEVVHGVWSPPVDILEKGLTEAFAGQSAFRKRSIRRE